MNDNAMNTVLIVDDDQGIRDLLGKFLLKHGYKTYLSKSGQEMREILSRHSVDLIILDIMMPGEDGMMLCRTLRQSSDVPIIMLTAIREEVEKILGLELGADDYLSKPFNPRELLARIRAILRRAKHGGGTLSKRVYKPHVVYHFEEWRLDITERRLVSPDSLEITLSSGEFDLLLALVERPQQVLSRDALLDVTKNRAAGPFDRSIDIQISRLRQKIERDHKKPRLIKTIRGGGYVFSSVVTCKQS